MANRHRCGRATAAIEPLRIILMGGIVAFIASSILLPIFKMSQWVK